MLSQSTILTLHRVGRRNKSGLPANQNMMIEPDELTDFIESSRKRGWAFISLDELLSEFSLNKVPRKVLILTFDDGYLDNYTEAYPLLKSYNAPFCVYVTSGFIGNKIVPWWYKLEAVIECADGDLCFEERIITLRGTKEKSSVFMEIRKKIMFDVVSSGKMLSWLEGSYKPAQGVDNKLFMDWKETETLSKDDLVTLGAHTHLHPVLATLDFDKSREEILASKELLERKLVKAIKHFAFPFGGRNEISAREINFVKDIGFKTAVTTWHGPLNHNNISRRFELPRVFFMPGFSLEKTQVGFVKSAVKNYVRRVVNYNVK